MALSQTSPFLMYRFVSSLNAETLSFFFTVVSIEPGTLPDLGPQMLLVK